MSLFHQLKRFLVNHFVNLRWYSLLYATSLYIFVSWVLLFVAGESDLVNPSNFFYWLLVTASTVGYGDFSPTTFWGKWIVAIIVIPFGLSLFAVLVGNVATYFASHWRKGVKGLKHLNVEDHILIVGWNGPRTLRLLNLIVREQKFHPEPAPIVLCVMADIENPLVDSIGFVKVTSFNDDLEMSRTNIDKARCIILDNEQDDVTMTTALYSYSRNPNAHTIAYFHDENLVPLLKRHCPNIECTPSVAVEMLAKAAADPGSSFLHHELLDVDMGMTQYSVNYPSSEEQRCVADFFIAFKKHYQATLIGVANPGNEGVILNPDMDSTVEPSAVLYYIADERIQQFDWSLCRV